LQISLNADDAQQGGKKNICYFVGNLEIWGNLYYRL